MLFFAICSLFYLICLLRNSWSKTERHTAHSHKIKPFSNFKCTIKIEIIIYIFRFDFCRCLVCPIRFWGAKQKNFSWKIGWTLFVFDAFLCWICLFDTQVFLSIFVISILLWRWQWKFSFLISSKTDETVNKINSSFKFS